MSERWWLSLVLILSAVVAVEGLWLWWLLLR